MISREPSMIHFIQSTYFENLYKSTRYLTNQSLTMAFYTNLLVILAITSASFAEKCTIREFSQVEEVTKQCKNIVVQDLTVPGNQTLKLSLLDGASLVFQGKTSFEYFNWKGPLVTIRGNGLKIEGKPGHVLHGNGELYWDGKGAKGVVKPKFLRIQSVTKSTIQNINIKNCPVHCVSIQASDNVVLSKFNIDNSEGDKNNFTGHNTDGFDIGSNNIIIKDSIVKNQDDCVAVNRGHNITLSGLKCYGGHGLSISVGFSKTNFESNTVSNVLFENSLVHFSPNGIHLKTHSDSGPGVMQNIVYRNIKLEKIANFGINIQQDYADGEATGIPGTNIPITGLTLENISGYMESFNKSPTLANYILCGKGACTDWKFEGIHITGAKNNSSCNYVPEGFTC
ncbi:unnamed protein product [Phyllotreta striolata]|uniref:endo-polygalacturonase n=1 Tax=Phyllotreta striolata TaxID=444603 RepID=A0A9N9TIS9_PHYSR|nr:unnamed protein product [Phyllotreta striolata]